MAIVKEQKPAMMRYYKKKQKILEYLGGKCSMCSSTNGLEIDHINWKEKSFTITSRTNLSWNKLKLELDKCQLLCKSCHDSKSIDDRREQVTGFREQPHGSYWRYKKYKCRCEDCIAANKIYRNKYKKPVTNSKKAIRYGENVEHGQYVKYRRGCRCELCKKANTVRIQKYRIQKESDMPN